MGKREAMTGLEIAEMVYWVAGVDRSRPGWVKVTTGQVLSDSRRDRPRIGDAGVLVVITPRGKQLREDVVVLDHVFVDSGMTIEAGQLFFDFWFKTQV